MEHTVHPIRLLDIALRALEKYLSDFMRRLVMNPSLPVGRDLKYHYYQDPCRRLEEFLSDPGRRLEKYLENPCICLKKYLENVCPCLEDYLKYPCKRFEYNEQSPCACLNEYLKNRCESVTAFKNPRVRFQLYLKRPCKCLESYIKKYDSSGISDQIAVVLARCVNNTYNELMNTIDFKNICEEVAPQVLKSVITPFADKFECFVEDGHPSLLDYYKVRKSDLIYKSLSLFDNLRVLKIEPLHRTLSMSLAVENTGDTLQVFSSKSSCDADVKTLAEHCKNLKSLDISQSSLVTDRIAEFVLKFPNLEELNLCDLTQFTAAGLQSIIKGLSQTQESYDGKEIARNKDEQYPAFEDLSSEHNLQVEESNLRSDVVITPSSSTEYCCPCVLELSVLTTDTSISDESVTDINSSQTRDSSIEQNKSQGTVEKELITSRSERIKLFGCSNPSDEDIHILSEKFPNINSLVLSNVMETSLSPLRKLKFLNKFSLRKSKFQLLEDLLEAIGRQLKCLNITDVSETKLEFIAANCLDLQCLHLCFQKQSELVLPRTSGQLFVPSFNNVTRLQVHLINKVLAEFVITGFENVRNLFVSYTYGDDTLLETILQRKHMKDLQEIFWGNELVIRFSEECTTVYEFLSLGKISIDSFKPCMK
ncbi:uncharacterized protein [Periplaneta americana]|uniref:uncharacterized protein n=1 Tax=Periplaneta americana TaxID=6978 RepID=UPI0037E791FD